jgi:hypothetical protein
MPRRPASLIHTARRESPATSATTATHTRAPAAAPRATVVGTTKARPTETQRFSTGDVWYFPRNYPHSILGLEPKGCTFVAGFDSPSFDERKAFSASGWLSTVNVDTLALVSDRRCTGARACLISAAGIDGRPLPACSAARCSTAARPAAPHYGRGLWHTAS